jgi:hypothetical protein
MDQQICYTDINRLHDVLEGRLHGRGCGKSFATAHVLAGAIQVQNPRSVLNKFVVGCSSMQSMEHFKHMFEEVARSYGLWFKKTMRTCWYNDKFNVEIVWYRVRPNELWGGTDSNILVDARDTSHP